ncbi:MAG TPA: DUF4340 domain-containing protein [Chthoniobacteraceae bacterium]
MKLKNTLILLLLAAVIFAFIALYEKHQPTTQEARERAGRVVQMDRDEVKEISIKNAETKIELRKGENNVWTLNEPVKDRADSMAINQLFTTAESLKHDAVIGDGKGGEKDQLKEFGLANPEIRVKFTGGEKPVELLLGKDAAVEGKIYVKRADDDAVYVIPNELKNLLTKKVDEFRDHKLTDVAATQVNRIVVKTNSGEIELQKKDEHWSLVKPLQARADASKVGDLISKATNARAESFIADASNPAVYGLQEPRGTVSMFADGREKPEVLQIGGKPKEEKDKDKIYAQLSSRDAVVILPQEAEKLLETQPNDLRDRNLVRVEADIVDRVTLEAAGGNKVVLARSGESWVRKAEKDLPVATSQAARVISDLQAQQVVDFVDADTNLAKYGLDQPQVKVTLSSYASENTAESGAGEKPIVTVLFGKTEGASVYAKVQDEPFVVTVPNTVLGSLPADPLQWQELTIFKLKPEEIVSFEVTKANEPAIALVRDKDQWKLAKGDGAVNQVNAQSLINTISSLSAVRWAGVAAPEHGIDKPSVVVSFKDKAGTSYKLTTGAKTPEEMWYATAEGKTGTFLLSRPDVEAAELPLIEKAAPAQPNGSTKPTSGEAAPATAAPATPAPTPGAPSGETGSADGPAAPPAPAP